MKVNFDALASDQTIIKTKKCLEDKNITVTIADTKKAALEMLISLLPKDAEIMTGGSVSLEQIGFTEILKTDKHPWINLKEKIINEKDPVKQMELRRKSASADYFIGSVHAVTESGVVVYASATGSQIPAYTFSSPHVIWIVGTQKITDTLDNALKRVREYVFPLEDQHMKTLGFAGSSIGKIVISEREFLKNRVTLIFVKEQVGF